MNQEKLFHEDIYEALRTDVMALGGYKKVGLVLFPEKADKAGDYLSTCLNTARNEKLDPAQTLLVKKMAAQVGSYATKTFENQECNLAPPERIEPEDELAKLQRMYIDSVETQKQITGRMERLFAGKS